jgi:hypothetical protein
MEIEITNTTNPLNFAAEGLEEIYQNVKMILNTRKGSVPLDREFGLDWQIIDSPTSAFVQKLKKDIAEQIEKYEPRVKLNKILVMNKGELNDGKALIKLKLYVYQGEEDAIY